MAELVSTWSKDRSRKCGAVIVNDRNVLIAVGWNGFPRGVDDATDAHHERPIKYKFTEHAERNAIYNAAAHGLATHGCRMYNHWYPCADCARAIIQAGIKEIICQKPDWKDEKYAEDFHASVEMFRETKMVVRFLGEFTGQQQ